jgi:membrane protease YdiL (CAAX protease family)
MLSKLLIGSVPVIVILVAAAFVVPPGFPLLLRQVLLFVVGVGGTMVAERLLFGPGWTRIVTALGFVAPGARAATVAIVVSVPMWSFLPLYGRFTATPVALARDWLPILLGVILVNGLAEEAIHRAFIFGHLRETRSFRTSAAISAVIFAAQHVYLLFTIGAVAGLASVGLALALAFPLAFLYERGGNSLGAPAILHTSSNAPMMLLVTAEGATAAILPHMGVVLVSMYLSFAFGPWLRSGATAAGVGRRDCLPGPVGGR